jgi:N-acetylmuramoyl-L-alanine amidase
VWVAARHRIRRHAKVNTVLPARHVMFPALAILVASALAACGGGSGADTVAPAPAASVSAPAAPPGPQRVVLLDPGHNSGNATHLAEINKQVPDGRGGTKPCNTVGTAAANGYPEHLFNWNVADDVRSLLESNGIKVIMTRAGDPKYPSDEAPDDVGPCVDVRGKMAAQVNADLEISIHADGAPTADHGFHIIYAKPALNTAQGDPSISLATAIRDGMTDQQLTPANYAGKNGLIGRSDLAGLNLAKRPSVLIECGNMKNPQDAINMTTVSDEGKVEASDAGQARIAQGIGTGILNWLARHPPGSLAMARATQPHPSDSDSDSESESPSTTTTHRHHTPKTTSKSLRKTTTEKSTKSTTENSTGSASTESDLPQ